MRIKNIYKLEFWAKMLWTGQVYGTSARLRAKGAPRAALKRFRRWCTQTLGNGVRVRWPTRDGVPL